MFLRRGLQGLFFLLLGCFGLLYVYGFASMVDPTPAGWDRGRLILGKMFDLHGEILLTLTMAWFVVSGVYLMLTALRDGLRRNCARK